MRIALVYDLAQVFLHNLKQIKKIFNGEHTKGCIRSLCIPEIYTNNGYKQNDTR